MTVAVLLALIGLTPGILALLGAPSIGALMALSVADKVGLAQLVIGLLPHDPKTLGRIHAILHRQSKVEGYLELEFVPPGGPGGWGRAPEWRVTWHKGKRQ
jgi:hypothetical protein